MPKDIPIPREFTDIYGDYGIWNTIRWTLGATKMQQDEISLIDQTDLGKHPEEGYIKTSDSQPHADHMLTWVDAILKSNLSISDTRGLVEGILSMHERIFKNTERSQTHLESLIEETVILITPYHLLYTDTVTDLIVMNYTGMFGHSTSVYNVPGPSLVSMGPLEQYRYDIAPMWSHYANTRSDVSFLDTVVITEPMIRTPTQTTEMECWHEVLVPAGTPPEHIV